MSGPNLKVLVPADFSGCTLTRKVCWNQDKLILQEAQIQDRHLAEFGTKNYVFNKVLDLTDPTFLQGIGLETDNLIVSLEESASAYNLTQKLGHIAKFHGYDAIFAPSAMDRNFTNVIILKGF